MKKILLIIALCSILNAIVLSQSNRFIIRSGIGYYMDVFTSYDGPIIWLESGLKFKTGFYANCRLSIATMDWSIKEGLFKDYETVQLRQMLDLTFSKPLNLKNHHILEPGIGVKLKKEYFLKPEVEGIYNGGNIDVYTSYSQKFYEIGFSFNLDYYYQFTNNFLLGLRIDSNVIWALGFEGLTISPLFGFRF